MDQFVRKSDQIPEYRYTIYLSLPYKLKHLRIQHQVGYY